MCRPSANTENSRRMREKPLAVPSHFHIQFNRNCLKWGMKGEQGWCSGENTRLPPIWTFQGPVVRTPISANPQLNFNPGFFFFLSKVLSRKMFSIPFRVTYHQILGKEIKLNLLFKLWYSNSNFALKLDYFKVVLYKKIRVFWEIVRKFFLLVFTSSMIYFSSSIIFLSVFNWYREKNCNFLSTVTWLSW